MVCALCILFLIVGILSALCYLMWRQIRRLTAEIRAIRPLGPDEFHRLIRASMQSVAERQGLH